MGTYKPASDSKRIERIVRLKTDLHEHLVQSMDLEIAGNLDPQILRQQIIERANELCIQNGDLLTKAERTDLVSEVVNDILGLGPIDPLLSDPEISDILINGPFCVYVEKHGKLERTNIQFRDNEHLVRIVQRIAANVGRRIDESSPMVDARLPDGSRVNAVISPLALDGALVSIRQFGQKQILSSDLIESKTASIEMLQFLEACVKRKINILISGGTGSGKTTLLNVLSGFIPTDERVITIEDAAELQLQQPHVARMETRPANLEGQGKVETRDLLINALRMRPDRIIIGECRSSEAFDLLQALNTGHNGSMATIHANDTRDAIGRLELLVSLVASDLSSATICRQIASAVNIIVQIQRVDGGCRKITKISEITGCEAGVVSMHDIFVYEQIGIDGNGNVIGEFRATGITPKCFEGLQRKGYSINPERSNRDTKKLNELEVLGFERSGCK